MLWVVVTEEAWNLRDLALEFWEYPERYPCEIDG